MNEKCQSECAWCGEPIEVLEEDQDVLTFCSDLCVNLWCETEDIEPVEVHRKKPRPSINRAGEIDTEEDFV